MINDSIRKLLTDIENESVWDYHRIFDTVKHGFLVDSETRMMITIGSRIIYVNENLCALLKYSCDELVFTNIIDLIPAEDLDILYSWMERLKEKKYINYMMRGITADNNYIWVRASSVYFTKYKLSLSFFKKAGRIPADYAQFN